VPELPEVETTRRGIAPHVEGRRIDHVVVRTPRLRWAVPAAELAALGGTGITGIRRRAKYLLLATPRGHVMLHLGMSGSLRVIPAGVAPTVHDHLDIVLDDGACLRLRDPRRFGSVHWLPGPEPRHPLLDHLGPEPWDDALTGGVLHRRARGRRRSVKAFIMDSRVIAGVGNIYANEALFAAGIHPRRAAGRVSRVRYEALLAALRRILERAIAVGGTTLRDFTDTEGAPGYFRIELAVYGRADGLCAHCATPLACIRQEQRATWYCPRCQR